MEFLPKLKELLRFIWLRASGTFKLGLGLVVLGGLSVTWGLGLLALSSRTPLVSSDVDPASLSQVAPELGVLIVDVGGAVVHPGVYQLNTGDRWAQAVQLAGGMVPTADPTFVSRTLNLATPAKDGDKIYIPFMDEGMERAGESLQESAALEAAETSGLISINQASPKQLEELPGIGAKRAEDIISNRPYSSIHELVEREVVTETIFEQIKGLIKV